MGKLLYDGTGTAIEFDDRELAHLQTVIYAKLRRNEAFAFSWNHGSGLGGGRSSIWVHPTTPLQFTYYGGRPVALNRTWIDALMTTANSVRGLVMVPEPQEAAVLPEAPLPIG